jgi:pyruvate kinase
MSKSDSNSRLYHGAPYLSKLESIASSAVRAADKVGASLIVVYTHTGARRVTCAVTRGRHVRHCARALRRKLCVCVDQRTHTDTHTHVCETHTHVCV